MRLPSRNSGSLPMRVLVLACLLIALLLPSRVRADVGVGPILPGGSSIMPEDATPIQMAAEKVVMTVRQGTDAEDAAFKLNVEDQGYPGLPSPYFPIVYLAVTEVDADFSMLNPTNDTLPMTVWFPMASVLEDVNWEDHIGEVAPRIEGLQVAVEGNPLEYDVTELPNPQGEDKPPLPWASFPVTFPASEEVHIHVNYIFLPQPSSVDLVGMTLTYVFQTGAGWAGSIGKAELEVNLPYPASSETIGSMPDGGQANGQRVSWTWKDLEPGPEDDFSILLLRPERWEELRYWLGIVDAHPDFEQGWLALASLYERLCQGIYERGHLIPYFGETYQQLGVQAAQEAARLDPSDIGPHYELAMMYAAALPRNPPPDALQFVLEEVELMYELNPEEARALEPNVNDILELALYNDATATAEAAAWAASDATETTVAAMAQTPSSSPTASGSPPPVSATENGPEPAITAEGRVVIGIAALGAVALIVVASLMLKRRRGSPNRLD